MSMFRCCKMRRPAGRCRTIPSRTETSMSGDGNDLGMTNRLNLPSGPALGTVGQPTDSPYSRGSSGQKTFSVDLEVKRLWKQRDR